MLCNTVMDLISGAIFSLTLDEEIWYLGGSYYYYCLLIFILKSSKLNPVISAFDSVFAFILEKLLVAFLQC